MWREGEEERKTNRPTRSHLSTGAKNLRTIMFICVIYFYFFIFSRKCVGKVEKQFA
jgi:hypothetical protein